MKATLVRQHRFRRARYVWTMAALFAGGLFVTTGPTLAAPDRADSKYERHRSNDRDRGYDRNHGNDRRDRYDRHRGNDRRRGYDRHRGNDRRRGYDRHPRNDRRQRYDRHHRRSDRRYDSRHRGFTVPRSIARQHRHRYDDYYYGRAYFSPHRHYHSVYRFPVYAEGRLDYRPYAYCNGKYHATGYFGIDGPHFSIHIGF